MLRENHGYYLAEPEQQVVDRVLEKLQIQLSEKEFTSALETGRAMTDHQVIELALDALQSVG